MIDSRLQAFVAVGDAFAEVAKRACSYPLLTPEKVASLVLAGAKHRQQMAPHWRTVSSVVRDLQAVEMLKASMIVPPFASYCECWQVVLADIGHDENVPTDYVTLLQCAGLVNRGKRSLERWKTKDPAFPTPEIIGDDGEADEWRWSTIRPYLEAKAKRKLPETFPAHITT